MSSARDPLAAAGLATIFLVAGCGPSSSSGGANTAARTPAVVAAAAPKACDILSADIAKKYLGTGAQLRRNAQPNPRMTQCQWGSDKGVVTIMVGPWDMVHDAAMNGTPTPGFGDEAYIGPGGLDVRKGARGINIDVIVQSGEFWGSAADAVEAQAADAEKKVAPDLVAKL